MIRLTARGNIRAGVSKDFHLPNSPPSIFETRKKGGVSQPFGESKWFRVVWGGGEGRGPTLGLVQARISVSSQIVSLAFLAQRVCLPHLW